MANSKDITARIKKGADEIKQKTSLQILKEKEMARQAESKAKQEQKKLEEKALGVYRKTMTDSFVATFDKKYGDDVNYDSVVKSLNFKISERLGKKTLEVNCIESDVEFKSDVLKRHGEISDDQRSQFISNQDIVKGIHIDEDRFSSFYEREGYNTAMKIDEKGYDKSDESRKTEPVSDGIFVPTSRDNRYGTFHRIQRDGVYTPVAESVKEAEDAGTKAWNKQISSFLAIMQ